VKEKDKYPYPSRYGSHESMIVATGIIVCEDEFGEYDTEEKYIDSGLADPNRWSRYEDN